MLKRKPLSRPLSTQVSFVINTVKGEHFGKQNLLVSVNQHLFVLEPRTIQKRFHFYDAGFNLYIEPNQMINISIGVISPLDGKGFLHAFLSYKLPAPTESKMQNIELHSFGDSYIISLSLFISPCYIYPPVARSKEYKPTGDTASSQNYSPKSKYKTIERRKELSDSSSFTERYSLSYTVSESSNADSEDNQNDIPNIPRLVNSMKSDSSAADTTTLMSYSD